MAYSSGVAGSLSTLLTAIATQAVAAGWSSTGSILSKGTSAFKLAIIGSQIEIRGGLGFSGETLTTPSPGGSRIGGTYATLPYKYEIFTFTDPDEVIVVINYNNDYYQQLSFGISNVGGNVGSPWFTAACNLNYSANGGVNLAVSFKSIRAFPYSDRSHNSVGLFVHGVWAGEVSSSFFYNSSTPVGWKTGANGMVYGSAGIVGGLLNMLPSVLTGSTVLLPIKATCDAGSSGLIVSVALANTRFCRIDNLTPGEIVSIGSSRWKVYPWLRKDSVSRNGGNAGTSSDVPSHSGTYGYAVKYEGP